MAYELADRQMAGAGLTKAASAYAARRDACAAEWMPFTEALVGENGGFTRIGEQLDHNLRQLRKILDKAAGGQAFGMSARGARETHTTLPYDPELFRLRAELGSHQDPPRANGHARDISGEAL